MSSDKVGIIVSGEKMFDLSGGLEGCTDESGKGPTKGWRKPRVESAGSFNPQWMHCRLLDDHNDEVMSDESDDFEARCEESSFQRAVPLHCSGFTAAPRWAPAGGQARAGSSPDVPTAFAYCMRSRARRQGLGHPGRPMALVAAPDDGNAAPGDSAIAQSIVDHRKAEQADENQTKKVTQKAKSKNNLQKHDQ